MTAPQSSTPEPKQNKSIALVVGSALGVLILGGGIAYWFFGRSPTIGGDVPTGARVTPEDTFMTVTVSTDETQWTQLQRLGTAESQALLRENLNEWRDRLLTANDLTYEEHIKPWVGDEVTIAIMAPQPLAVPEPSSPDTDSTAEPEDEQATPSDASEAPDAPSEETDASSSSSNQDEQIAESSAANGNGESANEEPEANLNAENSEGSGASDSDSPSEILNPDLINPAQTQSAVLFLPIAEPLKAQEILTQVVQSDTPPNERDYEGVTIRSFQSPGGGELNTVVLDRQLVALSLEPEAIEQVIDTYRGNASVVEAPGYRQALRTVSADQSFAKVYVNSQVAEAIAAANSTDAGRSRTLAPLQNNQGLAASVSLNSNGLRFQGTTWLTQDSPSLLVTNRNRYRLAERLPAETMMMASGSSLKVLWDSYSDRAGNTAEGVLAPKNITTAFQTVFGLNLEADVMAWMDGWFSLALVPTEATEDLQSAGLVFLVEASDPSAAKQTFNRLDEVMQNRFQFQVNDVTVGGQEAVNWRSRFASLTLTRGWLDNSIAFLAFNDATKTMLPRPNQPLADSEIYRKATQSSLNSVSGVFFVNVEALNNARDQIPVPQFPENQAAIVEAIRAIGVTTSVEGDRQLRYAISVVTDNANSSDTSSGGS